YPVSVRLARLTVDKVITAPCGTRVLYPTSGEILKRLSTSNPQQHPKNQ
ncbi:hypothetical protein KSS87_008320, partial [Heliosperma pusillum]